MEVPKSYTGYTEISKALSAMIKFADENEDFLLAAKLDDARDVAIQRHDVATK
jgi:hypothetical protein